MASMSNDWPPPMFRDHVPAVTGAYSARPGNLVRPVDGMPTFRRIGDAVEAARHSVWLTVAFCAPDFRFPDGRALLDVLDDTVARGLDVRVLFWRPKPESSRYGRTFPGTTAELELLRARGSQFGTGGTEPGGPTAST